MTNNSISPNNGKPFASWTSTSKEKINYSLEKLQHGTTDLTSSVEIRRDVLKCVLGSLAKCKDDLASLITEEVGKTPSEAYDEIPYASSFIEVALGLLDSYSFESELNDHFIRQVPRGTGLLIAPYNDPVAGLTRKIAPCIAAGAAALVKPSNLGVQCAMMLNEAFSDAGIQNYINILPILENEITSQLVKSKDIGTVSFTGSTQVGLKLAGISGQNGKSFIGELGGTNPFVLMKDADLDKAIPDLIKRKIKAAGQACSAPNIVFVEKMILKDVEDRLISAFEKITYGPASNSVDMGPLRTSTAIDRLARIEARLQKDGEVCIHSSRTCHFDGFVYPPKLYRVSESLLFEKHEIFAPLMAICAFDQLTDLQNRLVHNRQPLVLYMYGKDINRIKSFISPLKFGSIGINTTAIQGPDIPTGGFDLAGVGREGGLWGMTQFLTTINQKGINANA